MAHLFLKHFTQGIHSFGNLYVKKNKNDNIINWNIFVKISLHARPALLLLLLVQKALKKMRCYWKTKHFKYSLKYNFYTTRFQVLDQWFFNHRVWQLFFLLWKQVFSCNMILMHIQETNLWQLHRKLYQSQPSTIVS